MVRKVKVTVEAWIHLIVTIDSSGTMSIVNHGVTAKANDRTWILAGRTGIYVDDDETPRLTLVEKKELDVKW